MPSAKFTADEVLSLRARKARGETIVVKDEADRFGCSIEVIRRLLRGETFRHLSAAVPQQAPVSLEDAELSLLRVLSEVAPKESLDDPDGDILAILERK